MELNSLYFDAREQHNFPLVIRSQEQNSCDTRTSSGKVLIDSKKLNALSCFLFLVIVEHGMKLLDLERVTHLFSISQWIPNKGWNMMIYTCREASLKQRHVSLLYFTAS